MAFDDATRTVSHATTHDLYVHSRGWRTDDCGVQASSAARDLRDVE